MCLFCDIVNKKIPCYTIYEDQDFLAFLDISQSTKGHTLLIPKKHYDSLLECPDEEAAKIMSVACQLAKEIVKKLNANGINVLTNAHEIAGQTVHHLHFHLIPRYNENDGFKATFKANPEPDYQSVLTKLKMK